MQSVLEVPDGVREGNEKLVKVTVAASTKIFQLIEISIFLPTFS